MANPLTLNWCKLLTNIRGILVKKHFEKSLKKPLLETLLRRQVEHKAYLLTSVVSFAHLKEDKNVYKYKKKLECNRVERSNTRIKERS